MGRFHTDLGLTNTAQEAENRKVWARLLRLIDDYDLYGHVAYPKRHELHQVPAIYQWAASRRGVFVNPALNEPFGLHEWQQKLAKNWRRDLCLQILDGHPALTRQSDRHQSRFKLSYFIQKASRGRADVLRQELETSLARAALKARIVCSHGNLLDVLPAGGGKAAAVDFVCQQYDIPRKNLVTAGDSGNDLDLLEEAGFGIVVANHTRELSARKDLHHIHWARAASAAGVMEGLKLFHSGRRSSSPVLIPSTSATTGRAGPDRLTGGTAELEAGV